MALRSATACASCRKWMLRSFIASIGGPAINTQRRTFSALPTPPDALHELEIRQTAPTQETQPAAHIPWYLQSQPVVEVQKDTAAAKRQRLPDLPEHPPPLLQPLLQHVSTNLGMDDLTLIDLREMDPPPALGANLLMIVGSARSEKHLHVSADRLCRWLRTEHHLSPFADGLLGRNELKLKMRRLAKKKKLMSAVGNNMEEEIDDGIRTGWVCVNVGRIEGGDLPKSEEQVEREKNIIGFGTGVSGCRVVVQLMTEEKRAEIEIERLWTAVLRKNRKERGVPLTAEDATPAKKAVLAEEEQVVADDSAQSASDTEPKISIDVTDTHRQNMPEEATSTYTPMFQDAEPSRGRAARSGHARV